TTFGPRYEQYTAVPSHPCVTSMASQNCSIPVSAIPLIAWFNGSLRFAGYPSSLDGALRLVGPAPSMAVTNVNVGNGTFNVALLPGTYSLYATSGTGGGYLANASSILVLPTPSAPTVVWLHSTWTETVTLSPPAGASNTSLSTIWFHSPNGASLTFFDVPYYTPVSFVLPVGQYTIQANGTGAPYGVATNSTAIATAYLLTGNSAADLTLAYSFRHTASLTVVPPTKVTVSGGTRVSFSLVISNTGNAPETLKLSGTPSYWNFTFSPANVTLGVTSSNRSASAQVSILVPAGTPVAHPTIQIEAIVASTGAVAGFATPLPEVDVLPVTGLTLGSGAISGAVISPYTAVVPFWVLNTGNLPEGIVFSVADAARLSGLGWESKIVSGRTAVVSTQLVQPGQNSTYSVELISPAGHALPPGTVMVSARVVNGSGGLTLTRTLTVPTVAISANASSVYATGPGIGSPPTYPDWLIPLLAFVPAIALVSGVLVYRWWRTRRWSRR
ncbi:MAG: hypothetical protein L3J96_07850, partial [Thermoplasmata archaeon]|nr:hypothetical protein [Thermoplasmata archaeon]